MILDRLKSYFFPRAPDYKDAHLGLVKAKFKVVENLAFERYSLNSQYAPYAVEHPIKLAQRAAELVQLFASTNLGKKFESNYNLSLHLFKNLTDKSKVSTLLQSPIAGKSLLTHIKDHMSKLELKFIYEIPKENPFYHTDLVVFHNDYNAPLPLNGIIYDDFLKITRLYHKIVNDQTNLKIKGSLGFKTFILKAFLKLLTRPHGRELISGILDPSWLQSLQSIFSNGYFAFDVIIKEHPSKSFVECKPIGETLYFSVNLTLYEATQLFVKDSLDQVKTEKTPLYISLAHELIHVRHWLLNKSFKAEDKKEIKDFTDAYEKATITGTLNGKQVDSLSENSLREQFNFYPRVNHLSTYVDYYWAS